ncbi:MAG: type II toxin-antitoxin system PemK/MazF family toxin [Euryarchaeota archaeon]|nr:type II toxin-antitoxin system PemK/MazF family toxin [Euryarchaeota archaeon]
MNIDKGDLLLVNFPFTNFEDFKRRPVLVVSGEVVNKKTRDLVVCAVTTNPIHRDFGVGISQDDLSEGHLKKDSIVKTSHIATISKSIVIKRIGTLNEDKMEEILESLCGVFKD